ncbi:uroporphyrinogen-III synthase [Pelistega sp. NLN82]|uniref:Uroporphyrinogen-III synthase n=1 Tax=Pelistega ratti TaxID=2652177 RepID=A0A6L9Y7B6_9BURK|nr:uroporphyrinogen-III synthase [Pelistega ratti]NEN76281.1 uroporphyrinogen-III synthase [Pelistega ratti]
MQHLIILTRPVDKNYHLSSLLKQSLAQVQQSATVLSVPALMLKPFRLSDLTDNERWSLRHLEEFDAIFCVSSSAVEYFFHLVKEGRYLIKPSTYFLCVGQATQAYLLQQGVTASQIICAEKGNDSEALWHTIEHQGIAFSSVLVVRAETGREWFKHTLQQKGIKVKTLAIYRREPALLSNEVYQTFRHLHQQTKVQWVFTSSEGVLALLPQLCSLPIFQQLVHHQFIVIHPKIATLLKEEIARLSANQYLLKDEQIHLSPADDQAIVNVLTAFLI